MFKYITFIVFISIFYEFFIYTMKNYGQKPIYRAQEGYDVPASNENALGVFEIIFLFV